MTNQSKIGRDDSDRQTIWWHIYLYLNKSKCETIYLFLGLIHRLVRFDGAKLSLEEWTQAIKRWTSKQTEMVTWFFVSLDFIFHSESFFLNRTHLSKYDQYIWPIQMKLKRRISQQWISTFIISDKNQREQKKTSFALPGNSRKATVIATYEREWERNLSTANASYSTIAAF